jgi:hypothetical protein
MGGLALALGLGVYFYALRESRTGLGAESTTKGSGVWVQLYVVTSAWLEDHGRAWPSLWVLFLAFSDHFLNELEKSLEVDGCFGSIHDWSNNQSILGSYNCAKYPSHWELRRTGH